MGYYVQLRSFPRAIVTTSAADAEDPRVSSGGNALGLLFRQTGAVSRSNPRRPQTPVLRIGRKTVDDAPGTRLRDIPLGQSYP